MVAKDVMETATSAAAGRKAMEAEAFETRARGTTVAQFWWWVQTGSARRQSANDVAQLVTPVSPANQSSSAALGPPPLPTEVWHRRTGTPTPVARNPRRPKIAHTLERL